MKMLLKMFFDMMFLKFADESAAAPAAEPASEAAAPAQEMSSTERVEAAMKDVLTEKDKSAEGEQEEQEQESNIDPITGVEKKQKKEPHRDGENQDDDPEYELDLAGKKEKIKLSQLKKGYMQESDYTRKMQEFSKQREEISPLVEFVELAKKDPRATEAVVAFVEKLIKDDGVNSEFIDQFLGFTSGKEQTKPIQIDDMELNQALSDIDPESGVGKALKQILTRNQALEKNLQQLSEGIKTREQKEQEAKQQEAYQAQVKSARTFYENTVETLAKAETGKFKFESPDDLAAWKDLVKDRVAKDNTIVNNNEEFGAIINQHAKAAFDLLTGVRERALRNHLEKGKTPLPVNSAGGGKPPAGSFQKGLSLQENIEQMLNESREKG